MEYEIETEITYRGAPRTARAVVTIEGRYHQATWGYDGGEPAEYPEARIVEVHLVDCDDDEADDFVPLLHLSEKDEDRILDLALDRYMDEYGYEYEYDEDLDAPRYDERNKQ
jgi:hypothetical protein